MSKQSPTIQDTIKDDYEIEKRKLEIEHQQRLEFCKKNLKSRDLADRWYFEHIKLLDLKTTQKLKIENLNEKVTNVGNKMIEPIVNVMMDGITNISEIGDAKEKKQWNSKAKNVNYLETVKNEITTEQFEIEFQQFRLKNSE